MRDSLNNIDQYQTNLNDTVSYMTNSQTAITTMGNVLNDAITTAVQGANASYSASDRATMASDVDNKINEMIQLGNTQSNGSYIFAGFKTGAQPFTAATSASGSVTGVTYSGDSGLMPEEVQQGQFINKNIPGDYFTTGTDVFKSLITLRDDLNNNDTTAIQADIATVTAAHSQVVNMGTDLGGKLRSTTDAGSSISAVKTTITKLQSSLSDADVTSVMTSFSLQQNVYQAAISSISKILQQTTLADILR
jgi:flagellar hook-associated protein 3 FlgL